MDGGQHLAVEYRPIDTLIPYAGNARTHDKAQAALIAGSIREFGFVNPVPVDGENGIIAGHGRVLAARKLEMRLVPVIELGYLTEAQKRALVLADNKLAERAGWDAAMLALEVGDLQGLGIDMADLGFTGRELDELLRESGVDPREDEVPEVPDVPVSRLGDLWLLGRHRLICSDATDAATVARVLDGTSPHLMVTDPPYGVAYDPSWRNAAGLSQTKRVGKVANDDRADWRAAWALFPGEVAYVWHGALHAAEVAQSLEASGFAIRSQIIWVKERLVLSRGHYHWQHEPCQPTGTMVEVPGGGSVPIETLKDGDRVVSYSAYEGVIKRRGRSIRVASRAYQGELFSVRVGNAVTRATDGHQFSVRFAPEASDKHIVYLMRGGRYWRVGHTGLYNSRGFGMSVRMAKEAGDAAWILAVTATRMDASVLEQIIHCRYGVPTTHWEVCDGFDSSLHRSADHIERIYETIGFDQIDEGARRLLSDYRRRIGYPFVCAGDVGAFSRVKTRTIRACNLVPELMQVPVPTSGPDFEWRTIADIGVESYVGPVYSMDVDKDQHYVADGLITHNCWYAVRDKGTGHWSGDRKQTTLWTIATGHQDAETVHGTQKPVECMRRPMLNNSSPGQAVYEPFSGSGTTLIAAETTGRIAHAMELDPAYVDVAVQRWQAFTGQQAKLAESGRTFADCAAERASIATLQPRGEVA